MTAATAPAPTIETLRQETAVLDAELKILRSKCAAEQKTLDALEAERGKISEGIALGTAKPSAATEHARKTEQSRATVAGFTTLIAGVQKRYGLAFAELARLETEAKRAAEIDEIAELKSEGAVILARIAETLKGTIGVEIFRYNEIRKRFGVVMDNYAKVGGFPIPPAALAARDARNTLDKQLAVVLAPIQKMIR